MAIYEDHTDYTIRAWLQEPVNLPEEGRADVARRIRETPQQRHWWPTISTRRSWSMFSATKYLVAGVVLAIVSGALIFGLTGPQRSDPVPIPAATSDLPTPSASPEATPSPSPGAVSATTNRPYTRTITEFPAGTAPTELVRDPDGPMFYVDSASGTVVMVDVDGFPVDVVKVGDSNDPLYADSPTVIGPRLLTWASRDLRFADADGSLWYWRNYPSGGNLVPDLLFYGQGRTQDDTLIGARVSALASFTRGRDDYDLYALDPERQQVLRYRYANDSALVTPEETLDEAAPETADGRDLYVDPDIYVLTDGDVVRYRDGQTDSSFQLDVPSGTVDYRYLDGIGSRDDGRLFVYDAASQRILEFAKADGRLVRQWASGADDPALADVRGLAALAGEGGAAPVVTWMTMAGIYESLMTTDSRQAPGELAISVDPATHAAVAAKQQTIATLRGRLTELRDKNEKSQDDRAAINKLANQISRLQRDIQVLLGADVETRTAPDRGTGRSLDWQHPGARFRADRLQIESNGLTFAGVETPFDLKYSLNDGEFFAQWRENGRLMRLVFYLGRDATHWWVNEIWTYDGRKNGGWLTYERLAPLTRTPRGKTLQTDFILTPDSGRPQLVDGASLRIDGLRLRAFEPGTEPAPLEVTGCRPLDESDGVMVEMEVRTRNPDEPGEMQSGLDYYAEGALLEGVDQLPPAEASARLAELGICHEFEWASDLVGDAKRIRGHFGYAERWCTVPPFVRQRDYGDREPRLQKAGGTVSRFPFSQTREGYVRIYVEDEKPRERRQQPPAGWNCPTY